MHNFNKLTIWTDSMSFCTKIYEATQSFPHEEIYGLTSQIRRAAVSIPANIAEGCGRASDKEFHHFLSIALGSAFELQTELEIAQQLGYLSQETYTESMTILSSVQTRIYKLIQKYN